MCREYDCPSCGLTSVCDAAIIAEARGEWGSSVFDPLDAQNAVMSIVANRRGVSPVTLEALQRISDGKEEQDLLTVRETLLVEQSPVDVVREWEFDRH